jgi:hypothetical protein
MEWPCTVAGDGQVRGLRRDSPSAMSGSINELEVLRGADRAIDEQRLVFGVGELQPDWAELERYAGPLPPQAVRALEVAARLPVSDV